MNWVTIFWSTLSGVCLMLALLHLLVWSRDRSSRASLFFCVAVFSVIGMAMAEMVTMHTESIAEFSGAIRWTHLIHGVGVVGFLGFVHFYFGTGRWGLLVLALFIRFLAVVANFSTGESLHVYAIHSLQKVNFLGQQVTVLGEWAPNPWVRLGQLAMLIQVIYVVDASTRLWRTGSYESRRRAVIVGGGLSLFLLLASAHAGLVAAGVLRMPFLVSLPFLGVVLAMGYELSRDLLRAAKLSRDLRESEQRMTLAAEAANLGIWIRDLVRNEIWASSKWRALFGYGRGEKLDLEDILQRLHPEDRETVRQVLEKAMAGSGSYETEYRIILPNEKVRWIASRGRVEFDEVGKPILVRGVSIDITGRKQAELEASRQRRELAHLSRVSILGELAGSLAHELNQPLTAMLSNAQAGQRFLAQGNPDMAEITAILDDIADDAKRAGSIIHGMRAMFKKDAAVEMQPVDLNDELTQVLKLLHSEIVGRHVHVELHLENALPVVHVGRVEIQQVLMNLILNSLDAMKAGVTQRHLKITTGRQDDRVVVRVHDNGPGIPEEMLERLFEPFFSTKPGGLGLGLAISRSIMEQFGGRLQAENHAAGGAVFSMAFPVAIRNLSET